MTNSQPTIWRSSNSHQSEFGCVLMSPRPNKIRTSCKTRELGQIRPSCSIWTGLRCNVRRYATPSGASTLVCVGRPLTGSLEPMSAGVMVRKTSPRATSLPSRSMEINGWHDYSQHRHLLLPRATPIQTISRRAKRGTGRVNRLSQVWRTRSSQPLHKPKCPNRKKREKENSSTRKQS
jgi:hypothetical protein